MAKKQLYAVGILFRDGTIKYVTSLGEHHTARWDDGEKAMLFSKEWALDMCRGFAWNGISAVPVLKLDWIELENTESEEN